MSVAPPRPKGPALNAMRAFEAAARLQSFVAAAEELSVTPGAVSQHVKTLEGWAGMPLFRRHAQGIELTPAGRSLLPEFVRAFDQLGVATQALRSLSPVAEIHIAALPSVAQLWLPARLGQIRARFPQLKFSVTAMETPPNLERELFDLSLFFGVPEAGIPEQIVLEHDHIFPVCAPSLAAQISSPDRLNDVPLLQDQTWNEDWVQWSDATGAKLSDPRNGPRYSLYSLAVEEAKSGAGVLMGHASLIEEPLAAGTLVPVGDSSCETGRALVLSLPTRANRGPEIADMVEFLRR